MAGLTVLPAGHRSVTEQAGITTWHCFSSGSHYDPDNVSFGPLVTCDVHAVKAGAGFGPHRHAGVVIVSWPLDGVLTHESAAHESAAFEGREIPVGTAQRQYTGVGVEHAEYAGASDSARFLQMALLSDEPAGYWRGALDEPLSVATRLGLATLTRQHRSRGWEAGGRRFVIVTRGAARLIGSEDRLPDADTVDLDAGDSVRVPATTYVDLELARDAEALIWQLP